MGKEKILSGVQDAEQRLNEATERLAEAKTQLEQSKLIIDKIKSDKEATRRTLAVSNGARVQEEALRRADSAKLAVMYKKQQVLREVKGQVTGLSLNRVITTLKDDLTLDKHPVISMANKKELVNTVMGSKLNPYMLKFLQFLIDRRRIAFFETIGERYLELVYEFADIKVVTVKTVVPLSYRQERRIN